MKRTLVLASLVAGCVFVSTTSAATITLSAVEQGWYDETGFHNPGNTGYTTGWSNGMELRSFFSFDLSGVSGTIVGAALQLLNPLSPTRGAGFGGFSSPDASETFSLFGVGASSAALAAGGSGNTDIFADLGSGTALGEATVSNSDNGQIVTINLNADGIAALNNANGILSLGGAITSLTRGDDDEFVFGYSGSSTAQLEIDAVDNALAGVRTSQNPEPASLALWAIGAIGIAVYHRRRRTNAA
jgi:hypothetical protein